jgi:hypothetical protein
VTPSELCAWLLAAALLIVAFIRLHRRARQAERERDRAAQEAAWWREVVQAHWAKRTAQRDRRAAEIARANPGLPDVFARALAEVEEHEQ